MLASEYYFDIEALRKAVINELLSGATAGMPAMLVEVGDAENADPEELVQIAKRYGLL